MRELTTNEFEDVNGGLIWFAVAAVAVGAAVMGGDAVRDNHTINSAAGVCGDAGVASVDTRGLTGGVITCQPGG